MGQIVFRYAGEIFDLGERLQEAVSGAETEGPLRLSVGIVEAFPKLLAHHIIAPALQAFEHLRIRVDTAPPDRLFAQLAVNDLDLVIFDAPHEHGQPQEVDRPRPVEVARHLTKDPDLLNGEGDREQRHEYERAAQRHRDLRIEGAPDASASPPLEPSRALLHDRTSRPRWEDEKTACVR
ncbi:MAG: hypothetical protein RQ745_05700 [Longimicrobiales bacterium]|nr:hypothetical protein [Longimicrobiales bacterium]